MGANVNNGKSQGKPDDIVRILNSVRRIVRLLRLFDRQAEESTGLSGAKLFVLGKLAARGPLSMNELAEQTHTHQSSVSVVVTRLVEAGLVARKRSASDGRQLQLSLTAAGVKRLGAAPPAAQERLIESLRRMPRAERSHLAALLETLVAHAGIAQGLPDLFFEEFAGREKFAGRQKKPASPKQTRTRKTRRKEKVRDASE